MALDGRTGKELWTHRTHQEIFALNCNVDIDNDGVKDCLSAGRTGVSLTPQIQGRSQNLRHLYPGMGLKLGVFGFFL